MTSRRLPALVGFLVLLVGLAVVLAVAALPGRRGVPATTSVPRELPGYSHLTADVVGHPLGRAVALYRQGFGVEFADTPQALALGSDGRTVRRVDLAVQRGRGDGGGDPGPVSLSPDGTRIAIGDRETSGRTDLALVDVRTGATRTLVLPASAGSVPVGWSRDGRELVYVGASVTSSFDRVALGPLFVLDVGTGTSDLVAEDVSVAAFSPDGTRIAVQGAGGSPVRVLDRSGAVLEQLDVPAGAALAGGDAWSPGSSLLAVVDERDERIGFLPTGSGPTAGVPDAVPGTGPVLGWLSDTEVLVHAPADASGDYRIARADLTTGASAPWTSIPTADANYAVSDLTLATGLLPDAHLVAATDPDRGPWPLPLRVGLLVAGALMAFFATDGLQRRSAAVRSVASTPDWATDSSLG